MPTVTYDLFSLLLTSGPPPISIFTESNAYPDKTEVVNFTDQSTGPVVSWAWTFGDGATSTLQNPTHAYATDGYYVVTLLVSDAGAHTSSSSYGIHVQNAFPIPGLTGQVNDSLTINFDIRGSGI